MHHHYADIRERIDEEPLWWDEYAVPRYCEFHPKETANIYANECCLLLIECQECKHEFKVCVSRSWMDYLGGRKMAPLEELIESDQIHYGDPPNACPPPCVAGATMNSVPVRVLEFWRQTKGKGLPTWVRDHKLERLIDCEWARDE